MTITLEPHSSNLSERWDRYWARVSNEDLLAAKALIELSPTLVHEARRWVRHERVPVYASDAWDAEQTGTRDGELEFRWATWLASYDEHGRGWSSTEHRLFAIAASLLDVDRPTRLAGVLDELGSWRADAWRILAGWGLR